MSEHPREIAERLAALSPAKRALLERALAGAPPPEAAVERIPPPPLGPAPLSLEQRRLWFMHRLAGGGAAYTIPLAFRLRGPLDAAALGRAVRGVAARHDALRTTFAETGDGEAAQIVSPGVATEMETVDVNDLPSPAHREAAAAGFAAEIVRRPFDLAAEPPFRALLVRVGGDDHLLVLVIHHLVSDGTSDAVILRELGALYAAEMGGAAPLPTPAVQLPAFAAWQRERLGEDALAAEAAFWRAELEGAPHALELSADRPRPPVQGFAGAKLGFALPASAAWGMAALARAEGTTPFVAFLAAWAVLLARRTGRDDFLVGTASANRWHPATEGTVGFLANTLPLRVRTGGDPTARELVRRLHRTVQGARDHGRLPFDRIVEEAGVRRDASRPPLVQALFVYNDGAGARLSLPGVRAEWVTVDAGASPFELTLSLEERPDGAWGEMQYATGLFDPATARRLARHFRRLAAAIAADPDLPISDLPMAGAGELRRSAVRWNRTDAPYPAGACIHHLFEAQARATPTAVALVHGDREVTYAKLDRSAEAIAHRLRALGAGPEARVGVCLDRTPELVAALLGVLKAGAAYVPVDPAHPSARTAAVLRASGAALVITRPALWDRVGSPDVEIEVVDIDAVSLDEAMRGLPCSSPLPPCGGGAGGGGCHPDNLAYVIFTSGSTGGPQGVEIAHRGAVALLAWLRDVLSDEEAAVVLGSSSVSFDVCLPEILGTLVRGGTLVLVDDVLAAPPRPVRTAFMVPTAAGELLRAGRLPPGVRTLMLGGEPLSPALARALYEMGGVERVVNLYGPTEDTTYSTRAEIPHDAAHVSIGRPVANRRAYVLDAALRPVGIGVPGEVCLAGPGVARGYAGQPALTAERFVPCPFSPPGARMFRSRDAARWREDGTLDFLGRRDDQVKVRGFRIEPGEVEEALARHPAVREAAAAARPAADGGEARLVAWLVAAEDATPAPAELRAFLRELLPEYMAPTAYAWVPALPRTGSGKLDRRALPEPGSADAGAAAVRQAVPRSVLEERLAALWREVLGVERVGVHDDFFDLGGHSLRALRLVGRIREETGREVPVAALFRASTVERMARLVAGGAPEVRLPLVPLQEQGSRPPLFLGHPGGGHVVCYRTLAGLLAPDQPVYGLQARGLEDGLPPLGSVEEMAAFYARAIRERQPEGPYHLGGWSFGGLLAWEMACQLRAEGEEVATLALLDTAVPESDETRQTLDHARVLVRILGDVFGFAAAALVRPAELRGRSPRGQLALALEQIRPREPIPEWRRDELLALARVRQANLYALLDYAPRPYPGHVTYFRTAGSDLRRSHDETVGYWAALCGGIAVERIPGNHGSLLHEPHVRALARGLLAAMGSAEGVAM